MCHQWVTNGEKMNIQTAIEEFPKTLEKNSRLGEKSRIGEIAAAIEKIRVQNPAAYDERRVGEYLKQRAAVLKELVEEYFTASMASEFPLISDELFDLRRYLTLQRNGDRFVVIRDDTTLPEKITGDQIESHCLLFAYTPLFKGKHQAQIGSFQTNWQGYNQVVSISADLPGVVGSNLKDAHREAMRHYFATLADMFANPVESDILYSAGKLGEPEIGAIWIPTPESLDVVVTKSTPIKRDPAMILTARGNRYLVKTWQVDDEEPFEHYLREYSLTDLKGKLDSGRKK